MKKNPFKKGIHQEYQGFLGIWPGFSIREFAAGRDFNLNLFRSSWLFLRKLNQVESIYPQSIRMITGKVKIDGLPIPKGRLVKGPHKPICRDCAMYFSTTVLNC